MHILDYPGTEIREDTDQARSDFSSVIRLRGAYTLSQVRLLMSQQLISLAQRDLEDDHCKVLFIEPDEVIEDHGSVERIIDDTDITNAGQRGMMQFVDERTEPWYGGASFHTHERSGCISSLGVRDGAMPTVFVADSAEFLQLISDHASEVEDILDVHPFLNDQKTSAHEKSLLVADALFRRFSDASHVLKARLMEFQDRIKARLTGKIESAPKIGNVRIFRGDVVHAGKNENLNGKEPGVLAVQHWRRKAR